MALDYLRRWQHGRLLRLLARLGSPRSAGDLWLCACRLPSPARHSSRLSSCSGAEPVARTVGLVATLLVAVSPPLVVWAQQARGYSIAVLAVSLTWLMLVRLQASPTRGRHVTFCVLAIVTTYFLLTASLIVASGLLCLYLASADGRAKAKVMASAAIYLLGCLPLALTVLGAGVSGAVSWVAAPTWSSVRSLMSELSSGSVPDFFPPHLANAVLTGIVVLCWGAALATLFRSRRRRCATKSVIAVIPAGFVFWLVIPVVLDWIISVVSGDSIFGTSFLLPIVPGGLLLAAYGLASLRWQVGTLAGTVVLVGLSLAVLVPTYPAYPTRTGKAQRRSS